MIKQIRITGNLGQSFSKGFVIGGSAEINREVLKDLSIEVILERVGVSQNLQVSHPAFYVEIVQANSSKGEWRAEVHFSSGNEGQRRYGFMFSGQPMAPHVYSDSLDGVKAAAGKILLEKLGCAVTFHSEVLDYCYGWYPYSYQANDIQIGRFLVDIEQREVIDVESGERVARFLELETVKDTLMGYESCNASMSVPEVEELLASAAKHNNFHDCDTKKGIEYCMRRFVWFMNTSVRHSNHRVFILPKDMTINSLVSDQEQVVEL